MPEKPGPHALSEVATIFSPGGEAHLKERTPSFFAELDQEFDQFTGHILVTSFEFDTPWGVWEIHPHGDELVYLLEGDTDLTLKLPDGDRTLRIDQVGSYVVIPKNTWHTAHPHAPTRMLFITPGEGTQNEENPT